MGSSGNDLSYGISFFFSFFFFSLVLLFIWTYYSFALHSTLQLKKTQVSALFLITATEFLVIFVRLIVQRHMWCDCIIYISLPVVWPGLLVIWNAPSGRSQVVLSLMSWVATQSIAKPNHLIYLSVDKMKNCRFVKITVTVSFLNQIWLGFLL